MENYWDSAANGYDEHIKKSANAYTQAIELIRNELSGNERVLDIGTGTGEIPFAIADAVDSIIAIDSSSKMIEISKEKALQKNIRNIDFSVMDCHEIDYSPKSFDVIIVANLLHLIAEPESFTRGLATFLRDDGLIILPTFLHAYNPEVIEISKSLETMGHPIVNRFSQDSFVSLAENAGFAVKEMLVLENIMPMAYLSAKKSIRS